MASDGENSQFVTWKQFLAITVTYTTFIVPTIVGACAWLVGNHADSPKHGGAVSRHEFEHVVAGQKRVENRLEKLGDKVDTLLRRSP